VKLKKLDVNGVTIIELLVTCTIVAILSIVVVNFLGDWVAQNAVSTTRTSLLSDAQTALDTITDTVRLSSSADQNNRWQDQYAPGAPSNQLSWQSDADTLVLATAVVDTSNNIVFSDPANYTSQKNNTIYYVQNGSLYQRILAAPVANNKSKTTCPVASATTTCRADRTLAKNVQSFAVKYYNNLNQEVIPTNARSIGISLTLQKTAYKQSVSQTYSTRMVFRNE